MRPSGATRSCDQPKPPAFFLYIDQGEELYVRAEERQRRRFSELIAQALGDPRLRALMSLRADFFGALQSDEPLFAAHRQINVPPLREAELREVVSRPAAAALRALRDRRARRRHRAAHGGGIGQGRRRAAAALLSARRHVDADGRARRRRAAPAGRRRSSSAACWPSAPTPSSRAIRSPRTRCGACSRSSSRPCARTASRRGGARCAPSSPTRNGGWSPSLPTIPTGSW